MKAGSCNAVAIRGLSCTCWQEEKAMEPTNRLENTLLASACVGTDISAELIEELVELERDNERRLRRRGLSAALRACIEDYLRENSVDSH